MSDKAFDSIDANHNGSLDYKEIGNGLKHLEGAMKRPFTPTEWEWIKNTGAQIDSKDPGVVDKTEFWEFVNALFEHFNLCYLVNGHKKPPQDEDPSQGCLSKAKSDAAFKSIDKDHNGNLSYDEIKVGLQSLEHAYGKKWTKAQWLWIENTGKAIDSKDPGVVDENEFWEFANAVLEHFEMCWVANGGKRPDPEPAKKGGCLSKEMSS